MKRFTRLLTIPLFLSLGSCTIVRLDGNDGPARLESDGLIDGHLAFGFSDERSILQADLFDGSSDGAVAELAIWKLLRLELGLAGASVGVGPVHLGLGILAYEPRVPVRRAPRERKNIPRVDPAPSETGEVFEGDANLEGGS